MSPNPGFVTVDLDVHGDLLDPHTGATVLPERVADVLDDQLAVPGAASDIVVFVHGWRNDRRTATPAAGSLFQRLEAGYREHPDRYPRITGFQGHYVAVRWPSMSKSATRRSSQGASASRVPFPCLAGGDPA